MTTTTRETTATGGGMADLRVGILGFGLRSGLWRHAHRPGEGSRVVAVCDAGRRGRGEAQQALPEARVVAALEDLLALDLDAVLVLTPDHLHAEHAVATLRAGVATFLEKPIATTIPDADRILQTARATGTRLYIGHNMRHLPVITLMRRAIRDGAIGEVRAIWCRHFVSAGGDFYFKDWHADRRNTTGLLLQKGAHDIDVIHWLAGGYTRATQAVGALSTYGDLPRREQEITDEVMTQWYDEDVWPPATQRDLNPVVDVEDLSMANLVLDNGVLASYQQCHFAPATGAATR